MVSAETIQGFLQRHPMSSYDPEREYAELRWLIEGLWLGGGKINGLFGVPKSGKSRLLGWGLVSLLSGVPFLRELPVGTIMPERILYVHAEEDEGTITKRLRGYAQVLGVDDSTWASRLTFMPGMNMGLQDDANQRILRQLLVKSRTELLILDPYIRLHGADEQNAQAMAKIHNVFRSWVNLLEIDVVLIHHTGKLDYRDQSWQDDPARWARGSSDIVAMLDNAVLVKRSRGNHVNLYRVGRYASMPTLSLTDLGDKQGFRAYRRGRGTEQEADEELDLSDE